MPPAESQKILKNFGFFAFLQHVLLIFAAKVTNLLHNKACSLRKKSRAMQKKYESMQNLHRKFLKNLQNLYIFFTFSSHFCAKCHNLLHNKSKNRLRGRKNPRQEREKNIKIFEKFSANDRKLSVNGFQERKERGMRPFAALLVLSLAAILL